jgi:hypothetical protein
MRCSNDHITSGTFVANPTMLQRLWKDLRASLTSSLSDFQQLQSVCEFWSHAPLQRYVINWDEPRQWPTAWTLLDDREFDESAVSLAMEYTLMLGADQRWTPDRLQLVLATDPNNHLQHIMLKVDDRWLLNWEYRKIAVWADVRPNLHIHQRYAYNMRYHTAVERLPNIH